MKTKIIKNIWRINKKQKGSNSDYRFGAVIEYDKGILFVDLEEFKDEESFDKFVSEEDMNNSWTLEDTLPSHFCVEDYDSEYYEYRFKDTMKIYQPTNHTI